MTVGASEARRRLSAVANDWSRAASSWNSAQLTTLYSDDALLFGGRSGHCVGAPAIHAYFRSYDGVISSACLELVEQELREMTPTCALAQGYCDFAFVLSGGRRTRSFLRTTLLLDWSGGPTRIRAHHFSPTPDAPPIGG